MCSIKIFTPIRVEAGKGKGTQPLNRRHYPDNSVFSLARKCPLVATARFAPAAAVLAAVSVLWASASSIRAASVTIEAENATPLGASFTVGNDSGTLYIRNTSSTAGSNPGLSSRVASYSVTFPAAGTYDLYARVRVGAGGANNDSFFYGNGFGAKSPNTSANWILCGNLLAVGFTSPWDIVTRGGPVSGTNVWKWVNLSRYNGGATPINFTVTAGNLTQTFQIGGRDVGLDIDKLVFGSSGYAFTVADLDAGNPGTPVAMALPPDVVSGNLIQFNDNGGWSWYMDERAIIDAAGGKLVAGSDATGAGVGGSSRNGAVEAVIFDLQGGTSQRSTLFQGAPLGADDHNAPGLMLRPDGKYLAQWTGHNNNFLSYFSIYNGATWDPYTTFDWAAVGAVGGEQASYSNPHYLPAEDRTYTIVRSLDIKSMNILVSTNNGDTWTYYGKLNRRYPGAGYNPGYYRFSDNGVDRIDFICTESHPRDTLTSMYHGYISNGMSFKSDGTVVDSNLNDTNAPLSSDFTLVFANGTVMPQGMTNYRCWNSDVVKYPDGTIQAIIHARINQFDHIGGYPDQEDPNHAFFFCRYDGANWATTYLCQAGYKLYSDEADYVGLGALNPNDPDTIFISTYYDPRAVQPGVLDTNQPFSTRREIWKGVTTNHGAGFTWTPITHDSVRDNFRPIVPAWDANNTALLWFRGTYSTAQIYDAAVVGLLDRRWETAGTKTYVDATTNNTALATGGALVPSDSANQWHERTNSGNGGSLLASADVSAENAPMLKTSIPFPAPGTYDVWADFWGYPGADWRVVAGVSTNSLQLFRQMACKEVEPGDHDTMLVLSNNLAFLYQAYVGRVTGSSVDVFIDDNDIRTGTAGTTAGDTVRTWYDGVSYAAVTPVQIKLAITYDSASGSATLTWNSISPLLASPSTVTYTVQKKNAVTDTDWMTLTSGLPSAGSTTSYVDASAGGAAGFYRITSP